MAEIKKPKIEKMKRRVMANGRVLPANQAYANTEFPPTSPQEFRFRAGGKAWA